MKKNLTTLSFQDLKELFENNKKFNDLITSEYLTSKAFFGEKIDPVFHDNKKVFEYLEMYIENFNDFYINENRQLFYKNDLF